MRKIFIACGAALAFSSVVTALALSRSQEQHKAEGDHAQEQEGAGHVELTPEQRRRIGLEFATAGPGTISLSVTFPGEVVLDPDRLVHVVPRAAGIVREVRKTLGERVESGEILAWIESSELAEAKLAFYAKQAEVEGSELELPRAREIFGNTEKLMALLKDESGQEEIRKLDGLEMGPYRGRLLTAYAEYLAARETFELEQRLRTKEIASGQDLLQAETAFKKARERFHAAMDMTRYEKLVAFGEVARKRQVTEFEAVAAEQRLRLKGVDEETVEKLRSLVPKTARLDPKHAGSEEGKIPSVIKALGGDARFAWYPLRAPLAGFITEKHLTLGEKVSGEESVFAIADLSSVWVRFSVYPKDLASVSPGVKVHVDPGTGVAEREGTVAYVSPLVDKRTRTVPARIVLKNPDSTLRPGLFVTVHVERESEEARVVIPRSAVQVIDEEAVVFVMEGDGFEAVPVKLGAADRERVVVLEGLPAGRKVVTRGSFELKAQIVSSGLDPHAGHGH